jgi:hypothetical protein
VRNLLDEWSKNPREVPPWVRQGIDGVFDSIDLDITAWERIARPQDKSLRKAFKALLVDMAKQWGTLSSTIQWDSVPPAKSIWLCTRSNKEFSWTPDVTAEELLRWLTSTWKMRLEDVRDGIVPYYIRSQTREVWLNEMGRIAQERPAAKKKRKPISPLILAGPTMTPEQLRYRALVVNNLPIPPELAQVGLPPVASSSSAGISGAPQMSTTAPLLPIAGTKASQQDDELTRQIHDAVGSISAPPAPAEQSAEPGSSRKKADPSATIDPSRIPMDLDEPSD